MFACALILILLLPFTLAAPILEGFLSTHELDEMGIRLEYSPSGDSA
jgi:hypothetical protein